MISVQCSQLEQVKANPAAYGQLLASNDGKRGGGTHGMFACFQDVAKLVHIGELDVSQAVNELYKRFIRFEDNVKNQRKQELLAKQLVAYCKLFKKKQFQFVDGWRQMRMQLTPEARVTGRTPWVVEDDNNYYSFTFSERDFDWEDQLRFPLYQNYLATKTIDCKPAQMHVGIYSLESGQFYFNNYTKLEIKEVIEETTTILKKVYSAYQQKRMLDLQ